MSVHALLAEAMRTRRRFGIGLSRQAWQATRLRWSRNRLDPWEYYFFRVFLHRYPMAEKRRFIGWRREMELDRLLNTGAARDLANDKLKFCAYLQELGAPLPRVLAVYRQRGPAPDRTVRLGGSADVIRYLSDTGDYPLFVKPVRGAHGREAVAIRGISADGTRLELLSGTRLSTVGFAESMARAPGKGYLLQELLRTHARVGDICGDRLTSLRFVVLLAEDGPRILSVVWRVPTGTNVTDNFNVGFSGNLVARVDPATGGVAGIVQGAGWDVRPVDRHPDTGAVFAGLRLPDWERARALCTEYAAHFPDLRLQHWDIALTDRGPTILELNVAGGLRTHQIVASGPENLRVLSRFGR